MRNPSYNLPLTCSKIKFNSNDLGSSRARSFYKITACTLYMQIQRDSFYELAKTYKVVDNQI